MNCLYFSYFYKTFHFLMRKSLSWTTFAILTVLALGMAGGCGGNSPSTSTPAGGINTLQPAIPISKFTLSGIVPQAAITPSAASPFMGQLSIPTFQASSSVALITLASSKSPYTSIFQSPVVTVSASATPAPQFQTLQQGSIGTRLLPAMQPGDPLFAESAIRQRERQILSSVTPAAGRADLLQAQALISPSAYVAGDRVNFKVMNLSVPYNNTAQTVTATCEFAGNSAYIFVDNVIDASGSIYDRNNPANVLNTISTAFDAIYTTERANFGSEWNPGIDKDPRLIILISPSVNANGTNGILGYFFSGDELPPSLSLNSNMHEMFYVTNRAQGAAADLWADANAPLHPNANIGYNILAHEFQHMINFNAKFGHNGAYDGVYEDSWLNEGLSMYAQQLCGLGMPSGDPTTAGHVARYLKFPELFSLTSWTPYNYGMSYLFLLYLMEQYGGGVGAPQSAGMLQSMESGGLTGIANVESATGVAFDTVLKKWAMANLLDGQTSNPAYNYASIDLHGTYGGISLPGIVPLTFNAYPLNSSRQLLLYSATYQQFTGGTGSALNLSVGSEPSARGGAQSDVNLEAVVIVQ